MSLKINGIEPKQILVNKNGKTTEITKLKISKDGDEKTIWIKSYTLTISKGSHSTVTVGYKSSKYSMIGSELSNGSTMIHGGYIEITVSGHQGYKTSWTLNGVTQSSTNVTIQVTGNVNISVTETAIAQSLINPVLSGSFSYDSYMGCYYLSFQIKNNNPRPVTASILIYGDGDRLVDSYGMTVNANSTEQYNHGEMWCIGAKVQVTFSCPGYGDSVTSTTFGRYTGSGNSTDESTTTTTTSTTS